MPVTGDADRTSPVDYRWEATLRESGASKQGRRFGES